MLTATKEEADELGVEPYGPEVVGERPLHLDDVVAVDGRPSRSRFGRERWRAGLSSVVIACFVLVTAAGLVPASETSWKVNQVFGSTKRETGIRQHWGVFSPNPMQIEVELNATVYFDDGSSVDWRPPTENVVNSSRGERWRKWESRVRQEKYADHWPLAAKYIGNEFVDDPRTVVKVQLVRRWTEVPLPPEPNGDRQENEFRFYEWDHMNSVGTELTASDQQTSDYLP